MPDPSSPQFLDEALKLIWNTVLISRGNAFILFTSYSALETSYRKLAPHLREKGLNPLKQGDAQRKVLLDTFRSNEGSVLFGTDSFWEGVDVVGDALRYVILMKLPFKVPTEPIILARSQAITDDGGQPFLSYHIPNAIVKFKQGFGRLIRNKTDKGCILCLDNRLITKNYGKLFLNSLPPCHIIKDTSAVIQEKMRKFYNFNPSSVNGVQT